MPPSPTSSDPSASIAASEEADNNLQPFFVLHKPFPRKSEKNVSGSGRTRRQIDLTSLSPKLEEKSDHFSSDDSIIHERLLLQAFDQTWSKIETTIEDVLRQINLNCFDEVLQWVRESFSTIKSSSRAYIAEIQRPYPLVNDIIPRKVPTAFILTKNAEFVDDLLTFQELSRHLKSNGCHVANLSALDFSSKHGIGGCLRSLLRQLVVETPDVADIAVLASWYSEPDNYDNPIIVILDDMERCNGVVLSEFIIMLSEWVTKIPIFLVMGVATTVDAPRKLLTSDALQHLQPCKLTLGSSSERMNALVESVLVKPCSGFSISHKVALFLRNYFLRHDGTITSFIRALKLACTKHFSLEPLSFLSLRIIDENCEIPCSDKFDMLAKRAHIDAFNLPSCKREKAFQGISDSIFEGLFELRRLQKAWSTVVMCLYEAGKHTKIQLLDIFCEATDPDLYRSSASDHNFQITSMLGDNLSSGRLGSWKGGFIAQAIQKVRELPMTLLSHVLDMWSIHARELDEINDKVKELQSIMASADDGQISKERWKDIHKRSALGRKATLSLNDKAAMLLDGMARKFLTPIECIPLHEIICFRHVDILQLALIGDPRRTIQLDLLKPENYLQCCCCCRNGNTVSPSMHDTSIMYNLAQEYGDVINLHDWYQSFKSTIINASSKPKRKLHHSPASKKSKVTPSESEAAVQARFCRAVTELQVAGLLRMPSKRRPDFVQRIAFGL